MDSHANVFPAFIRVEYDEKNGLGFPAFEAAGNRAFDRVEKQVAKFKASTKDVGDVLKRALAGVGDGGRLDLDVTALQQQAAVLTQRAEIAKRFSGAMERATRAEAGFNLEARNAIAQTQMIAAKEEIAASAARDLASAMSLVQNEFDKTANAGTRLAVSTGKMSAVLTYSGASAGAARAGAVQLGQQLQDIAVQYSAGTSAAQIFAQQSGQVASALSLMGGAAGDGNTALSRLAMFMAGPWGIAIGVGASAVGALATKFFEVGQAASEAEKASTSFAEGLLDVQQFADKTTGKMLDLAGATVRAAAAMNSLKTQETGSRLLSLQSQGFQRAVTFNREEGSATRPGGPKGSIDYARKLRYDPDVSAALVKAGGPNGNLMVLEREIAAAAQRRPELRGLASDLAKLAAESVSAAKSFRKLGEEREFLDGRRTTVPGFTPSPSEAPNTKSFSGRVAAKLDRSTAPIEEEKTRSAERAQRELEQALERVHGQFDANAVAASRYAAALSDIEMVRSSGQIDTAQAGNYREQAAQRYFEATAETFSQRIDAGLDGAAERFRESLLAGGTALSSLLGQQLGGLITGLAQTEIGNGQSNQMGALLSAINDGQGRFASDLKAAQMQAMQELSRTLETLLGDNLIRKLGSTIGDALGAAGLGMGAGQLLLGSANSKIGSSLGGILGEVAGKAIGKSVGGTLGTALGPLGTIAGGILGGALGGVFNKTPMASAIVTGNSQSPTLGGSNSVALIQSLTGMSQGLQQNLSRIAEQFGAELGNYAVSFGQRGDYYRVAGTSTTAVGNKHPSQTSGIELLYDGTDAETAMRLAIRNALQDGAVKGIREGTKRLLQAGNDLDANLSKALKFEQVFKDLKAYVDPVGSALDEVNLKFRQLQQIFKDAGASALEMSALEDLYGRERADALKQVTEQITSGLKSFLSQLTTGDSGLSLRSRLTSAQAEYDPLRQRVASGDSSAYDSYTQAAQTLLDVQRQIFGSGEEYFASLEQITALTRGSLLTEEAKIRSANDNTFDTMPIVNATNAQTQALLAGLQPLLASIAASSAAAATNANTPIYKDYSDYVRRNF